MRDFVPYPLVLAPRYLEKPWGGRRMETLLGRTLPAGVKIGESWEVFDRDGSSSVVLNGKLAGKTLAELRGDTPFPLLFKILDATETLSVQVHPDAAAASRLGARAEAKTECWFVLHADPGAKVYRGLREGVTRADLAKALRDGTVDKCLHSFEVTSGDTVFVPAGTVHTIGAGVVLAEVQQNSDTTYRLFDWGRPREVHVEEALQSAWFGPRSADKVPPQVVSDDGFTERRLLVRCAHFAAESITAMGTFTLEVPPAVAFRARAGDQAVSDAPSGASSASGQSGDASMASPVPAVLHVLTGEGEFRPFRRGVEPIHLLPGTTILLPPRDEEFEIVPGASVLRALLFRA